MSTEQDNEIVRVTLVDPEAPFINPYIRLWDCPHLDASDMATYLALMTYSGYRDIYPSIATIARRAKFCVRTVIDSLKKLKILKFIEIDNEGNPEYGPGRGYTNHYKVHRKEMCNTCMFPEKDVEKHASPAHQIIHKVLNEGMSTPAYKNKGKRGKPKNLDLVQDLLPWMERVAGCLGRHQRKLNGSPMAQKLRGDLAASEKEDPMVFRQAWLDYLAGGTWRDAKWPYSHFLASLRPRGDGDDRRAPRKKGGKKVYQDIFNNDGSLTAFGRAQQAAEEARDREREDEGDE